MRRYEIVTKQIEMIDQIVCDICGVAINKNEHDIFDDFLHIEKTWGYNSNKDGKSYSFDVCEKCFEKIFLKK